MGEFFKWTGCFDYEKAFPYKITFYYINGASNYEDINRYIIWCEENIIGRFIIINTSFLFDIESDAIAFKLYIN